MTKLCGWNFISSELRVNLHILFDCITEMQNSSLWSSHDLLNKVYAHWIDRFHFILFFRWYKSPSGKLLSFLWVHSTIEDPKQDQFLSSLCKIFSLSFPYVVVVFFLLFSFVEIESYVYFILSCSEVPNWSTKSFKFPWIVPYIIVNYRVYDTISILNDSFLSW